MSGLRTTVTGDDDVTVLEADACILPWTLIAVAGITREAFEMLREFETVSFSDAASETHVFASAVVLAFDRRFSRKV